MEGKPSARCQSWTNEKRDRLASDGIWTLGVGLFVLVMVVVFVFFVVSQAEFDGSLKTVAGAGASSAPWDLLGGYFDGESDAAADVAPWTLVSEWPTAEIVHGR